MSSESVQPEIRPRLLRALTQTFSVLPDIGRAKGADDLYLVVSHSGNEYLVDLREGRCSCPDAEYNLAPDEPCKHELRAALYAGRLDTTELREKLDATATDLEHSAEQLHEKAHDLESSADELRDALDRLQEVADHE